MGIVVTVFMVLGLLHQSPISFLSFGRSAKNASLTNFIGCGLLLMGCWNIFWFGLRHLSVFWGQAALVSGVFMVMTALLILLSPHSRWASNSFLKKLLYYIKPMLPLWLLGLLACAILYALTLIRLNLGLTIIA
jgi:hypothetical protein